MTTKEIAMSIFNQFTEDELKALITLFSRLYPPKKENEILEPRQELIEEYGYPFPSPRKSTIYKFSTQAVH